MSLIVQKYGGSSVANPDRIRNVANRVAACYDEGNDMVVIVSAMGDTTDDLISLTNELNPEARGREMDMLLSTGEQQTVALLAMTLHGMGYEAISFTGWQAGIVTESVHQSAQIRTIDPCRIQKALAQKKIAIVAGFQGVTPEGEITTLGRGGSDTTAVAVAAALEADFCEIYTDVDGVYTTDPRMEKKAKKIHKIDYDEMLELATLGAGVLHPRCVEVGKDFNMKIHVRSSFNQNEGTVVEDLSDSKEIEARQPVTGIAFDKHVAKVSIFGVPEVPGVAAHIFTALADAHINVDMIVQGSQLDNENSISFTINEDDIAPAKEIIENAKTKYNAKSTAYELGLTKISIVGAGMITHPGVAAKMFAILSANDINIKMIATSEIKVSCIITADCLSSAVQALHDGFELDK